MVQEYYPLKIQYAFASRQCHILTCQLRALKHSERKSEQHCTLCPLPNNVLCFAGLEKERAPEPVVQQRFVSGLRRKGFKCPLRNPNLTAAEP